MKICLNAVPDNLFTALWVAKHFKYEDVKNQLHLVKGEGITNTVVIQAVMSEYQRFKLIDHQGYSKYESFFGLNFAILTRKTKTAVTFKYKSASWSNIIFLRQRDQDIDYINPSLEEIFPLLSKKDSLINIPFLKLTNLFTKTPLGIPLTDESHVDWQNQLGCTIKVYKLIDGNINLQECLISVGNIYNRQLEPYKKTIHLVAKNPTLYEQNLETEFFLVANDKLLQKEAVLKCDECDYRTTRKNDLDKHEKTEHATKIVSKQVVRGNPESILEFGVRMGFIPEQYINYRQEYICVFDIECLETEYTGKKEGMDMYIDKAQKIVSLAVGSNIPGGGDKFFYRKTSQPEAEEELIEEFVEYLEEIHTQLLIHLPE